MNTEKCTNIDQNGKTIRRQYFDVFFSENETLICNVMLGEVSYDGTDSSKQDKPNKQ